MVHRVCGDLDWLQKRLKLRVAPGANLPCEWCDGGRPPHPPFLHLQPHAAWVGTCHSPPTLGPPSNHRIFTIAGVTKFSIGLDSMHTMDLGVHAHFLGSCFHSMLYRGTLRGSLATREATMWAFLRAQYAIWKTPTRLSYLQRSLWTDVRAPHVDPPIMTTKAAENRQLVRPMVSMCQHYNTGSNRDNARLRAAVALARFQDILNNGGTFLTDDEHRLLMAEAWSFGHFYHQLNAHATNLDIKDFHIVNKFHFMLHLAMQAKHINPHLLWTYGYEDLVGRMKRLAMASKASLKPHLLTKTIFLKYRKVLSLTLEKAEADL